jgi:hypothetical protein
VVKRDPALDELDMFVAIRQAFVAQEEACKKPSPHDRGPVDALHAQE